MPMCMNQMKFSSAFGEYQLISQAPSILIVLQSLIARLSFIALGKWLTFTSNS